MGQVLINLSLTPLLLNSLTFQTSNSLIHYLLESLALVRSRSQFYIESEPCIVSCRWYCVLPNFGNIPNLRPHIHRNQ